MVAFSFSLFSLVLIPNGMADTRYKVQLETGSQVFEVKFFDSELWESVISVNSSPSIWYEGYSNITGAQSKFTDLSKINSNEPTSSIFKNLYFVWFNIPYIDVLKPNGYDYNYINFQYPDECEITYVYKQCWTFQNEPFNQFPHDNRREFTTFLNIIEINYNLNNYNNFASIVNNDTNIQSLNTSLPIITSDEFVWQYFTDFQVVPRPVSDYLLQLVSLLGCENTTVNNRSLIFYRQGNEPYISKYYFNGLGKIETIIIQNTSGDLIFKIEGFYPKFPFLLILGISITGLASILILYKYKKKKVRKLKISN